ncbi:putative DNA polymerase zeta catalytic subunit [Jimgerdemannia flammicorona]|uniref:DNA polymerase n=1 Tax=Jimgerdemannia flammicorona TaxID=994334 RepID=A0A433QZ40_9FUNG|nr:putative DNA polymerase zeta catalytic subunit [Jimgerdemannia flammicorona]
MTALEKLKRAKGVERGRKTGIRTWSLAREPPTLTEVERWLKEEEEKERAGRAKIEGDRESLNPAMGEKTINVAPLGKRIEDVSQIEGPTQKNRFGFKFSQNKSALAVRDRQHIDLFSVEVHVNTRGKLLPNPSEDPVSVIFWCLQTEGEDVQTNGYRKGYRVGLILQNDGLNVSKTGLTDYEIDYVGDERSMIDTLVDKVRRYDPDILTGYEIHNASWGYLIERAGMAYHINLCSELSRVIPSTMPKFGRDEDAWGFRQASSIHVDGRHMLNVWRLIRDEVNLNVYTFENVAFHVLHQRIPHFSYPTLTAWFTRGPAILRWRVLKYYVDRVQRNLELLDESEVVGRTSEFARVFGVDFFSVISRGSQFKVESMMLRIAKPENFIAITPNKKQVASQRAAECLPLVMEPESKFYNSPLVVLDFQSLYPSVMIAYNYCYSTCLGKIGPPNGPKKFGVTSLDLPLGLLSVLSDYITVSPNGLMYVKPSVRKGLLAKMLTEILETRVMVKRSMKENKGDKALEKLLNARQLGLKYITNVTYGYTGASYSGRMPGVEIADSIVQTGRETLERTIKIINSTERWGARVVYGDTDSVFIHLPGRSKDEAFDIGAEIAETITKMNPAPIRLKFEKVYLPCVLLAKKRYVGFKYETPDETMPEFDAKGIETVRRDGVPAVQKIMEQSLKILFRTQDLSELKAFLQRQWTKILTGRISLQDFIFAKEVKLGFYSNRGQPPPGALVSTKKMVIDPRSEPQYGERVPYVVVHGGPGARLRDQVVPPEEFLNNRSLRLHAQYYITKQIIPSLERVFSLVGADIKSWFNEMPRIQRATTFAEQPPRAGGSVFRQSHARTIDQYYVSRHCLVCREVTNQELCSKCRAKPSASTYHLSMKQHEAEVKYTQLLDVCASCSMITAGQSAFAAEDRIDTGSGVSLHPCDSMDCPVYFERTKTRNELKVTMGNLDVLDKLFGGTKRE